MSGRLVVVATPIGNLGDLSPRAIAELAGANYWLVEDTRVSAKLQALVGARKPMRVLSDHTPEARLRDYADSILSGEVVALVTDGGAPSISDPGARLVDIVRDRGGEVESTPGPSAVTNALALSGFYAQRFAFLGFLPRKHGDMKRELAPFVDSTYTLVLFESPLRTDKLLEALSESLGARRYAICREMTKLHQQVYRDRLPSVPESNTVPRKGEFTIVVEGKRRNENEFE